MLPPSRVRSRDFLRVSKSLLTNNLFWVAESYIIFPRPNEILFIFMP